MKFSDSIMEMLGVCATTVYRVGLQTAPNELCPRVPLMAWITCAFTIQALGTDGIAYLPLMPLSSFSFSKYIFLPWQKTYCKKRKSPSLGPCRTDRWDTASKNLFHNAFFVSVCICEASLCFSSQVWRRLSSSQLFRDWSALRLSFRATSAKCWQVCKW